MRLPERARRAPFDSLRSLRIRRRAALTFALNPVFTIPGYWVATGAATVWAAALGRGSLRRRGGLLVADRLPAWAFGRGGTTIGGVFLTSHVVEAHVIEHERVHQAQWRRFGLAFIPLYLAAGRDPLRNHFEVEAGLADGGYLPRRPTS